MDLYVSVPASIDEIPRIKPQELKQMMDNNEPMVILDCNPEGIYQMEHLPGALRHTRDFQRPIEDPNLPRDRLIVLYCQCSHEEDSGDMAMEMITYFGYRNIKLLAGGNMAWKSFGCPVQKVE